MFGRSDIVTSMISWIKKQTSDRKPKCRTLPRIDDVHHVSIDEDPYHIYDEIDDVTDDDRILNRSVYDVARAHEFISELKETFHVTSHRPPLQEKSPNIMPSNLATRTEQPQERFRQWKYPMTSSILITCEKTPNKATSVANSCKVYDEPWYEFDVSGIGELSKFLMGNSSNKNSASSKRDGDVTWCRRDDDVTWCRRRASKVPDSGQSNQSATKCVKTSATFPLRGERITVFRDPSSNHVSGLSALRNKRHDDSPVCASDQILKSTKSFQMTCSGRLYGRQSSSSSCSSGYGECTSNDSVAYDVMESHSPPCGCYDAGQCKGQPNNSCRGLHKVTWPQCNSQITRRDSCNVKQLNNKSNISRLHSCGVNELGDQSRTSSLKGNQSRTSNYSLESELRCNQHKPQNSGSLLAPSAPSPVEEYLYPVDFVSSRKNLPPLPISQNKTEVKCQNSHLRKNTGNSSSSTTRRQPVGMTSSTTQRPPLWANSKNRLLTDLISANYNSQMSTCFRW